MTDKKDDHIDENDKSQGQGSGDGAPGTQQEAVLAIADELCELFHDPAGVPLARLASGRLLRLDSREASLWLRSEYRASYGSPVNSAVLRGAMEELTSKALFDAETEPVGLRVGGSLERIEIDLGDPTYEAIRVEGGKIAVGRPSCNLLRRPQSKCTARPAAEGAISDLRPFLNVASDEDFQLMAAWTLMALRPVGPYPVLVLQGEQGSAKSTAAKVLKSVIDPVKPPVRSLPRSERGLLPPRSPQAIARQPAYPTG